MKETKKIRVKVKKRKLNVKNIFIFVFSIILIVNFIYCILNIKIKNIYVINNNLVSDRDIINYAKISNYPSYLLNLSLKIEKNILDNPYIKEVDVVKNNFKVYLYIDEHKPLVIYNNQVLLENNTLVDNIYNIKELPIVISNNIDTLEFANSFSKVGNDVLLKISQIEYTPTSTDLDRYLLYMNDGNSVYIKLSEIKKLNSYSKIVGQMNGQNGIIGLDTDKENISIELK